MRTAAKFIAALAALGIVAVIALTHPGLPKLDTTGSAGFLLFLGAVICYFAPAFVATARNCKAIDGILVVNVFLGWTFIGWVVALAWAASGETRAKVTA
jgi:hypothetical protein